jgi:hypothetical protein
MFVLVTTAVRVKTLLDAGYSRTQIARELGVCKSTVSYHARRLGGSMDVRAALRYDWETIQQYYDSGHTFSECMNRFGFSKHAWHEAKKRGVLVTRPRAMPIDQLLCGRRSRAHLKGRLIKAGLLLERCQSCGVVEWHGRPLALELHHINGDGHDNRLGNLALLCPNCHSQTDSWGGRNSKRRGPTPRRESHSARRTP